MASIRTRPGGIDPVTKRARPQKYEVRWPDPETGVRRSRGGFMTRRDAAAYVRELDASILLGRPLDVRPQMVSLAEHAERWLDQHPGKRRTVDSYDSYVHNHLLPTVVVPAADGRQAASVNLGLMRLEEIKPSVVRLWLRGMQSKVTAGGRKLSPATVSHARRVLQTCLQAAVDDDLIASNPVSRAKLPPSGIVQERPHLSKPQYEALVAATPARYRLGIVLMGECGLRWGEVSGLKLGRIDRDKRLLHVAETVTEVNGKLAADTPKSAAARRSIPLTQAAYSALLAHLSFELCGPEDYLLHTSSWAPLGYRGFRRLAWDPAVRAVDLPAGVSPHCLRHSYATWLLDAGVPIQTVRKLLGHASISTRLREPRAHPRPVRSSHRCGAQCNVARPGGGAARGLLPRGGGSRRVRESGHLR
jgi:integrase